MATRLHTNTLTHLHTLVQRQTTAHHTVAELLQMIHKIVDMLLNTDLSGQQMDEFLAKLETLRYLIEDATRQHEAMRVYWEDLGLIKENTPNPSTD